MPEPLAQEPKQHQALIRNFAKLSGKSVTYVHKLFHDTEELVQNRLKKKKTDKGFYALVVGILKKRLRIKTQKESAEITDMLLLETFLGNVW